MKKESVCWIRNAGERVHNRGIGPPLPAPNGQLSPLPTPLPMYIGSPYQQKGAKGLEVPFYKSVISSFVIDQDRIETNLLQLFAHTETLE